MVVRRDWFIFLNGFNTEFSRLEDTDFSLRLMYMGGDIFFEDRIYVEEIDDPTETVLDYLKKWYKSKTYLPLLYYYHFVPYYFPFSTGNIKTLTNLSKYYKFFFFIDFLDYIFELCGINSGRFPLFLSEKQGLILNGNYKKKFLSKNYNPNEISIFVGGLLRRYNVRYKILFRNHE